MFFQRELDVRMSGYFNCSVVRYVNNPWFKSYAQDLDLSVTIFFQLRIPKYLDILGDLKESPSLGESGHMTFSRMTKYSSLILLHIF